MGGHGSVAFSLIDADSNDEWRPLIGFFGIEPLSPEYAEKCQARGIPYEYFAALSGKSWRAWRRIYCWLAAARPDAIILHSVTALFPCLIYSRKRGTPLVAVEHQPNVLKSRSEWLFSYLVMLLADQVVVLTPDYDLELRERLGRFYQARKVSIVPNGIDTTKFRPAFHSVSRSRQIRLGMAARFTATKRQDVLIEMLAELHTREPDIDWRLSLAGGGVTWESIKLAAQAKGLDAYVDLPGQLDEEQLIGWYRAIDVYLHASEGETLSTSLLQAMASGLPVVASNVPGIKNLVSGETICGLLVDRQSPQGFAEAVIRLVVEPRVATEFGASGRRIVDKYYSHHNMFAKYMNLMRKI